MDDKQRCMFMNEIENRTELMMNVMDATAIPHFSMEKLRDERCRKISLGQLTAFGVAFEPLVAAIQVITGNAEQGTSGIYYVNTKGKQMMQFQDGSGFLGALGTNTGQVGGGQAVLTPLPVNPAMLFMAATLSQIESKLNDIQELQKEMIDFLKAKEKAKLKGNINTLADVLEQYKYNWNNEKYKINKHILVQDIRKDAEQSIVLYQDQICKKLSKKGFLTIDRDVKSKVQKLKEELKDYQLALYTYAFAAFLEIILLENFDAPFLESVKKRIEGYAFQYRTIYTECSYQIEKRSKSSVESMVAKSVAGFSKGVGKTIRKIPMVNKGPVDEALIFTGETVEKLADRKIDSAVGVLSEAKDNCTLPFIRNIEEVKKIYNEPMEVLFDGDGIYFLER